MGSLIAIALRATVVTLVLTGLAYPLAMTGVAPISATAGTFKRFDG